MSTPDDATLNVIEPLDPSSHDRTSFSCGIEQVDNLFRRTANKLAKAGNIRSIVMVEPPRNVIGFYATNVHAVDYTNLPARFARNRPALATSPMPISR